jgi:hypothetical protein
MAGSEPLTVHVLVLTYPPRMSPRIDFVLNASLHHLHVAF